MICQKHKLNFWCRVFEEYSLLLTKIGIDRSKNYQVCNEIGCKFVAGGPIIESLALEETMKFVKKNLLNSTSLLDECISIFKIRFHPFLDAKIFT